MNLRTWRALALSAAALTLTMGSAHVLEMPQKLAYDAEMYSAVNTTLYRYFAVIGGAYTMSSIFTAVVLAFLVRKRDRIFRWTLAAAVLIALSFVAWATIVAPVNGEIASALRHVPESVPALWMERRQRWELGHATVFATQLLGFLALIVSVVLDTPRRYRSTALAHETARAG